MQIPTTRILVVDDFDSARHFMTSKLANESNLQIIAEAADGVVAVQKAEELRPDLILLDIGLPRLNGIEAARRISKISPKSRILFVSEQCFPEVVQAALATGACGYVLKANAASELLPAVNSVLKGDRFVSSRLTLCESEDFLNSKIQGGAYMSESHSELTVRPPENTEGACRHEVGFFSHEVGFFSNDRNLLEHLTMFIGATLRAGDSAVVVATEVHREMLFRSLREHGLDVETAMEQGRYIVVDAMDTLSSFMHGRTTDSVRFLNIFSEVIATAAGAAKGKDPRVAIFGECVHLLWAQGNPEAAIQIERLCNRLPKKVKIDILCGYFLDSIVPMNDLLYERICAEHSAVYSTGYQPRVWPSV